MTENSMSGARIGAADGDDHPLGIGINSVSGQWLNYSGIEIDERGQYKPEPVVAALHLVTDGFLVDLVDPLLGAGASLKSTSDPKTQFVQRCGVLHSTSTYVLLAVRRLLNVRLAKRVRLTEEGGEGLSDTATFMTRFGDRYISEVTRGGEFFALIEIETPYAELRYLAGQKLAPVLGPFQLGRLGEILGTISQLQDARLPTEPAHTGIKSDLPPARTVPDLGGVVSAFLKGVDEAGGVDWVTGIEQYNRADNFPENTPVPDLASNQSLLRTSERYALSAATRAWTATLALNRPLLFEPFNSDDVNRSLAELIRLQAANAQQGLDVLRDPIGYSGVPLTPDPADVPVPKLRTLRADGRLPLRIKVNRGGTLDEGPDGKFVGADLSGVVRSVACDLEPQEEGLSLTMQVVYIVPPQGSVRYLARFSGEHPAGSPPFHQGGIRAIRFRLQDTKRAWNFSVSYTVRIWYGGDPVEQTPARDWQWVGKGEESSGDAFEQIASVFVVLALAPRRRG